MRSLKTAEVEITVAALRTYGQVLRAAGRMITTHPDGAGGLICEDRSGGASPTMWRISRDGSLLPDTRYSFRTRAFMPTIFPGTLSQGVTGTALGLGGGAGGSSTVGRLNLMQRRGVPACPSADGCE